MNKNLFWIILNKAEQFGRELNRELEQKKGPNQYPLMTQDIEFFWVSTTKLGEKKTLTLPKKRNKEKKQKWLPDFCRQQPRYAQSWSSGCFCLWLCSHLLLLLSLILSSASPGPLSRNTKILRRVKNSSGRAASWLKWKNSRRTSLISGAQAEGSDWRERRLSYERKETVGARSPNAVGAHHVNQPHFETH